MTAIHAPSTWYLAPADDLANDYAAGCDENSFTTREEADAAIAGLSDAFRDGTEWVAVQRSPNGGASS